MSGGHFDHKQYWINDIADSIDDIEIIGNIADLIK